MDRSGGRGRGGNCFAAETTAVLEDYDDEEGRWAVAAGSAASQSSTDGGDGGDGGGRIGVTGEAAAAAVRSPCFSSFSWPPHGISISLHFQRCLRSTEVDQLITYSRPLLTGSPQCKEDSGEVTTALELEFVKFISFFCPLALPSLRRLFWPVCRPVCASVSFCVFVALFWSS